MRNRWARSRRVVQAEHGQALILALIVMMIVSISAVSIVAVVTSTQNTLDEGTAGCERVYG